MTVISRAIPGLFGGVSQQIPAMRHPTQGELQVNALSTVVDGLYKRPGATLMSWLPVTWPLGSALTGNAHVHVIDRPNTGLWAAVFDGGSVRVFDMNTGFEEAVASPDGAGYLSSADPQNGFRCLTVADTTFVVNTNAVVQAGPNDIADPYANETMVYVRSVAINQTFNVTIGGAQASYVSGSTTNVGAVATGLAAAITASTPHAAVALESPRGCIRITASTSLPCVVDDTFGNSTMVVLTNGVSKFSDLPPSYFAGRRLRINGAVETQTDPYYVTWTGTEWQETRPFQVSTGLNRASMPYKLYRRTDGVWVFEQNAWTARLVGDEKTNPQPSFVGRTIRDVFFYRNRLGLLAGDSLALSRSGGYFNFYASTVTDVLDTDPIDLGGSAESVDTLDWAVPFNQTLLVWATSRQQFSLAGGDVLTPLTARLVPTTAFDSTSSARPKQMGSRIIYPYTSKSHGQIGLYRAKVDGVSNTMESITDHVPAYLPASPRELVMSDAFRAVVNVPNEQSPDLYFFKYEDDGDNLNQRAWQKFTFPVASVLKAHWVGSKLYLFTLHRDHTSTTSGRLALQMLDFDPTHVDQGANFDLRIDEKTIVTPVVSGSNSVITIPGRHSEPLVVLLARNGTVQQKAVVTQTLTADSTVLTLKGTWTGGTTYVGKTMSMVYQFTEIFLRDKDSAPVASARLKLMKMLARYVDTGFFTATVDAGAYGTYKYTFTSQQVGGVGQVLSGPSPLVKGDFQIPIQAPAAETVITLESDSYLPCKFPYAEWVGNLTMKAKR